MGSSHHDPINQLRHIEAPLSPVSGGIFEGHRRRHRHHHHGFADGIQLCHTRSSGRGTAELVEFRTELFTDDGWKDQCFRNRVGRVGMGGGPEGVEESERGRGIRTGEEPHLRETTLPGAAVILGKQPGAIQEQERRSFPFDKVGEARNLAIRKERVRERISGRSSEQIGTRIGCSKSGTGGQHVPLAHIPQIIHPRRETREHFE